MMSRTVCLLGTHSWSRRWMGGIQGAEIWSANDAFLLLNEANLPALQRVFNLHPRNWREDERRAEFGGQPPPGRDLDCFGRSVAYVQRLRGLNVPIYSLECWADIPASVAFPRQAVEAELSAHGYLPKGHCVTSSWDYIYYATSSWGHMMALLITEHLLALSGGARTPEAGARISDGSLVPQETQELRLAGVELGVGSMRERLWEHPCLTYWLGVVAALGIKVVLPPFGGSLLTAPVYGYDGPFRHSDIDHWATCGLPISLVEDENGRAAYRRLGYG